MKEHEIRELINDLRDIAVKYHDTQQLRAQIARRVKLTLEEATPKAYEIEGFGHFQANGLDFTPNNISTSIQYFIFEKGTVPELEFKGSMVEKYALQAIINMLQEKCNNMDNKPIPVILTIS